MTWVIWRQYRVTAAIAGAILAAFAVLLLITGLQDAAKWHAALANCVKNGACGDLSQAVSLGGPVYTLTILTLAVPILFGMFWGSPAVARERETGTIQFAWTQSLTRWRWLSVKAGWLLLAARPGVRQGRWASTARCRRRPLAWRHEQPRSFPRASRRGSAGQHRAPR
jgi:hypothetical protein